MTLNRLNIEVTINIKTGKEASRWQVKGGGGSLDCLFFCHLESVISLIRHCFYMLDATKNGLKEQ